MHSRSSGNSQGFAARGHVASIDSRSHAWISGSGHDPAVPSSLCHVRHKLLDDHSGGASAAHAAQDSPSVRAACLPDRQRAAESQSVFSMVNALMGAGMLGVPFCYKSCGLLLATLLVAATHVTSQLSMHFLLTAAHLTGKRSYEELAALAYGRPGARCVDACMLTINLGSLVAFMNVLADCWSAVAGTLIPPGAEPSRSVYMAVVAACAAAVTICVRSPQLLARLSQAAVGFIGLFAALLCLFAAGYGGWGSLVLWQWRGVGVSLPVLVYGFTAHQVMFSVYSMLRDAPVLRMRGVVRMSMSICAAAYVAVGAAGYSLFGSRTAGDLLRNMGGRAAGGLLGAYEHGLKACYGVAVLGTVPLLVTPFYATARPLALWAAGAQRGARRRGAWGGEAEGKACEERLGWGQEAAIALAVIGAALAVAVLVPNVELIFALTGASACCVVAYVLPSAIFLRLTRAKPLLRRPAAGDADVGAGSDASAAVLVFRRHTARVLCMLGLLAAVGCTAATLQAVQAESHMALLTQRLLAREAQAAAASRSDGHAAHVGATQPSEVEVAVAEEVASEAGEQLGSVRGQAVEAIDVARELAGTLALRPRRGLQQGDRRGGAGGGDTTAGAAAVDAAAVRRQVDRTLAALEAEVAAALTGTGRSRAADEPRPRSGRVVDGAARGRAASSGVQRDVSATAPGEHLHGRADAEEQVAGDASQSGKQRQPPPVLQERGDVGKHATLRTALAEGLSNTADTTAAETARAAGLVNKNVSVTGREAAASGAHNRSVAALAEVQAAGGSGDAVGAGSSSGAGVASSAKADGAGSGGAGGRGGNDLAVQLDRQRR